MHIWRMVRIAFIFLVMAHLFACGGGVPSRGTTEKVQLDTVTYRAELDSARNWFRTGRMREVDSVLHPILQTTDGVPELRKQRLHALSLKGQLFQRNSQLDSAMSYYQ